MQDDTRTVDEKLSENGFDGVVIFTEPDFASALIGVTSEGRAVYDSARMLEYLRTEKNVTDDAAVDWVHHIMQKLAAAGSGAPIIMHPLE